jgi:ribosomal silencing factor RsfS
MPTAKNIDEAINEKFVSKEKFAEDIEQLVLRTKMNYIDAIVQYCTDNEIEIESVGKLISKPLKEKIKFVATELNYMKKTSKGKLPL